VLIVESDGGLTSPRSGCGHPAFGDSRLTEILRRIVRRSWTSLSGVPSIVFGLFGNAFFCKALAWAFHPLGRTDLGMYGSAILIRATKRPALCSNDYRLSAAALGLSKTTTLWYLLLPAAVPGLMVGMVLGIGGR